MTLDDLVTGNAGSAADGPTRFPLALKPPLLLAPARMRVTRQA